jgi:secondary thiamine-phosphate synthase enzyme
MKALRESFKLQSEGPRPAFYMITDKVQEIAAQSEIKCGVCIVYTHHTTCSVMVQECSFDETYTGLEYLQQDLLDIFENLIPACRKEGQYMHPGPKLTEFAREHGEDKPQTLNTDAHLRSVFIGRSEAIPVSNGRLDLGNYGHIYFIDFDQTCRRERQVEIQIIGE